MKESAPIIQFEAVSKCHAQGAQAVWAVRNVSLVVRAGEFVSITGPSGSGKTTLLNLAAGLDVPTQGEVLVEGRSVRAMSSSQLARMRRETIAFIFQFFNLLSCLTAEQNVAVPLRASGMSRGEVARRVRAALEVVGMSHRAGHHPEELSGGELQRVAIARAFATDARVLLADEPTGNLDSLRGEDVLELLKQACERQGRSVLLVTHDLRAGAYGDRMLTLRDGEIVDEVEGAPAGGQVIHLRRRQ